MRWRSFPMANFTRSSTCESNFGQGMACKCWSCHLEQSKFNILQPAVKCRNLAWFWFHFCHITITSILCSDNLVPYCLSLSPACRVSTIEECRSGLISEDSCSRARIGQRPQLSAQSQTVTWSRSNAPAVRTVNKDVSATATISRTNGAQGTSRDHSGTLLPAAGQPCPLVTAASPSQQARLPGDGMGTPSNNLPQLTSSSQSQHQKLPPSPSPQGPQETRPSSTVPESIADVYVSTWTRLACL